MKRVFFNYPGLIEEIQDGHISMTTRVKPKEFGLYRIVKGSWFHQKDTGVVIQILDRVRMPVGDAIIKFYRQHGFVSSEEFKDALESVNKKKMRPSQVIYVHSFKLWTRKQVRHPRKEGMHG